MRPEDPIKQLENAAEVVHHVIERPPVNKTNHRWRQRGFTVHCDTCPTPHGFHVNHNEHLTGIDAQAMPIIEKIQSWEPQDVA